MNKEIEMFEKIIKLLFRKKTTIQVGHNSEDKEFCAFTRWFSARQLDSLMTDIDLEEEN